jgi:aspartokinase
LETIAVYWESRVKVYSITELTGLTLAQFTFPNTSSEQWGRRLIALESVIPRFELVIQDSIDTALSQFSLLFTGAGRDTVEAISEIWINEPFTTLEFSAPLEMVFLHGPHFQDRYGIVDIAFSALQQKNIDIIAAGCAGTTVYIVLPDQMGHAAKSVLTDTFFIPEGS